MSMLYPVSRLIKGIVEEKEQKLKETMKMMGLFDNVCALVLSSSSRRLVPCLFDFSFRLLTSLTEPLFCNDSPEPSFSHLVFFCHVC